MNHKLIQKYKFAIRNIFNECECKDIFTLPKLSQEEVNDIPNKKYRIYLNCFYGHDDFFKYDPNELISEYSDGIDDESNGLYFYACAGSQLKIMKYLEKLNPENIHRTNNNGMNAYLAACYQKDYKILSHLEQLGLNINSVDNSDYNAYFIAGFNNNVEIMEYLAKKPNFDIYHRDLSGLDIFCHACSYFNINVINHLIKINYDFNKYNYDYNPYAYACIHSNLPLMKLLESINYNIYQTNSDGLNAYELYINVISGPNKIKFIKYLETKGFKKNKLIYKVHDYHESIYFKEKNYKNYVYQKFNKLKSFMWLSN